MPARVIPDPPDAEDIVPQRQVNLPWPTNLYGGIAYALAKEFQFLDGAPETRLRNSCNPGDTAILVTSTFGFPSSGVLLGGGRRLKYTEKSGASFVLDEDDPEWPKAMSIPQGTLLVLDTRSVLPDRYDWTVPAGVLFEV